MTGITNPITKSIFKVADGGGGAEPVDYLLLLVKSSELDTDVSSFPLVIDETMIPAGFFANASDASLISVQTADGVALPNELAYYDQGASKLRIHVTVTLTSAVDVVLRLNWNAARTNETTVFADYEVVIPWHVANVASVVNYGTGTVTPVQVGTPTWTGRGLDFAGGTDAIEMSLDDFTAQSHYAISAVSKDGTPDGCVSSVNINNTDKSTLFMASTGRLRHWDNVAAFMDTTDAYIAKQDGTATSAAAVRMESGVDKQLWFDGVWQGSDAGGTYPVYTNLFVGNDTANDDPFEGIIYETRLSTDMTFTDDYVRAESMNIAGEFVCAVEGTEVYDGPCEPTPVIVDSVFSDYVTAASVTLTIPPEAEAGDILVLVGFIRAARTAPASGWTEHVDRIETGTGSVSQRLQVLSQTYNGTDVDVTFGTASSLRMGACLTVIRGATELLDFVESDMVYRTINGLEYDLPEVTNTADARRLCIQCYTSSYTENSSSATTTVNTAGGAEVMNLHNPMGTIGGATNSWARMAAIAFEVDPSDPTVITLPYCAIENRVDPTIPHCYFFVNPATEEPPSAGEAAILEVTIPAANIDADIPFFPLVIENKISSPIPSDWFATATGGVMIVKDAGGTELMSEVAYFDEAQNILRLHVLTPLSSTVDTVITVTAGTAATLTGTVFAGYELVVPIGYATDINDIKDFSPNDYSGNTHWTQTAVGVHPLYLENGLGVGVAASGIWTDSINVANNLYSVVDVTYGAIGTYTAMGVSDGSGTMDGLMLRNLSSFGRISSYSDGAGGWQETDNTANAAERGVGERFVASLRYESGVERSVFRDGIGKGTDSGVQNPFPAKTRVTIGVRDNTTSEPLRGTVFEIRVAEGTPPDEWVKAEALNMGTNELYSISVKAVCV